MYPTDNYPGYGSFVKNVCTGLSQHGIETRRKAVIRGRAKNKADKLRKYIRFYFDIVLGYFRDDDFLYVHFPNQAIPILLLLAHLKKRPVIINFHGEDLLYQPQGISGRLGRMMEHYCRRYVRAVVVPSSYFRDIVIQRGLIAPQRIIVSPSGGIDPHIFYPGRQQPAPMPLELGYVGRLERDKGVWEALYSCERMLQKQPVRLTIIGYGSCYDELQRHIADHGLASNVHIVPGAPQRELGAYYRKMHLFLFSSSRTGESLGLTGLEAMTCGVPVIGSNIGGIATYVRDKENGYLTTPADVDDMVRCIEAYLALSEAERHAMAARCIETTKKYLTPFVMQKLHDELLAQLEKK